MRGEDAGVSAGRGADVQVELDVLLQSEALLVFTPGEDGFVVLLRVVAADKKLSLFKGSQISASSKTQRRRGTHLRKCSSWE